MISYKPFFDTLKKKGISQYKLETEYGVSKGTVDNLRHNRSIPCTRLRNFVEC